MYRVWNFVAEYSLLLILGAITALIWANIDHFLLLSESFLSRVYLCCTPFVHNKVNAYHLSTLFAEPLAEMIGAFS